MAVEVELPATALRREDDGFTIGPPPGDEDHPTDNNTGNNNTGNTGGSSNTGGGTTSGGSSAPAEPKDPYDAWYTKLSRDDQDTVSQLRAAYVRLWGVGPPLAVLQAAINQGLNVWEFEEAQKRNPAWWKTEAAEDETREFDLFLEQLGLVPKRQRKGKGKGKGGGNNQGHIRFGPDMGPHPGGGKRGGGKKGDDAVLILDENRNPDNRRGGRR